MRKYGGASEYSSCGKCNCIEQLIEYQFYLNILHKLNKKSTDRPDAHLFYSSFCRSRKKT